MYRKIERISRFYWFMPKLKNKFPELDCLSEEEFIQRFKELNITFYSEKIVPVKPWIRVTLPFALLLMIIMILFTPILFMLTGKWSYELKETNPIRNWLTQLRILD